MDQFTYRPIPLIPWQEIPKTLRAHADESTRAYAELLRLQSRMARIRSGALRELGLTHARLRVLAVVAASPGLSISQIARELDLSRQAVHRVVHDMERSRLLLVEMSEGDRRSRQVRLTSLGTYISTLALPWERDWNSRVLDGLRIRELKDTSARAQQIRWSLPWTVRGPDEFALIFEREPNPRRLCLLQH